MLSGMNVLYSGYGCADHFLEADTYRHSWEVLGELLKDPELNDIIIETGMYDLLNFTLLMSIEGRCITRTRDIIAGCSC